MPQYFLGVDVGTGSARAGVFDTGGRCLGTSAKPIQMWHPRTGFAQQSSADIWASVCTASKGALAAAEIDPADIVGIGFDATCSLVVCGADLTPVTVDPDGAPEQDIIVWMDHRAENDASEINAIGGEPLRFVGGKISPEMQMPKLRWLAREMPGSFSQGAHFFDLPDWLVFKASGSLKRSLCSAVCKWTYLGHKGAAGEGWDDGFLASIGLEALTGDNHSRIGTEFLEPGQYAGALTGQAASELGLPAGIAVGASLIDAHAGAFGTLGADGESFDGRLAVIAGTSVCHIGLSAEAQFVPGVWGPYFGAVTPGQWCIEGGQSAAGALIDTIIARHGASKELRQAADAQGKSVWALLDALLEKMAEGGDTAQLTRFRHVNGDVLGNRSPLADPWRLGGIDGISTATDQKDLALDYLAAVQAVGYGTRHIIETMRENGVAISALVFSGGLAGSALFVREVADITGLPVLLPDVSEPVLLGASMLGALAAEVFDSPAGALASMAPKAETVSPRGGSASDYHDRKFQVYREMQTAHAQWRAIMENVK